GAWDIKIPKAVMDELVMPLPLASLEIDGDEAFTEQTASRPMTSVDVSGGQFDGQIRQTEFFVDADLSPYAGVSGVFCGTFFQPGVVTELTDARNGVEDPKPLARLDVESADVAFD